MHKVLYALFFLKKRFNYVKRGMLGSTLYAYYNKSSISIAI